MATRVATQVDVDNSLYSNWINDNIVPFHGANSIMKVGDVILDDVTYNYIRTDWRYESRWYHPYAGVASGNNINNSTYVISAAIDIDMPTEGTFVVETAEVLAVGTTTLVGTSGDITSVTVDGVIITSGAVVWNTSQNQTALDLAANIQANTSIPNYNASATNNIVTITAIAGTGTSPNGFVVIATESGGDIVATDVNMAGGVDLLYEYYHYSSYTGSTFTLDVTDHPTGLNKTYPGAELIWGIRFRIGATWWWDGIAMGMDFTDNTTWGWFNILGGNFEYSSTNDNPVIFRPLRGQVIFKAYSLNGLMLGCGWFENIIINGECVAFPGYRNQTEIFVHGTFGFLSWDIDDEGDHCFSLDHGTNIIGKPSFAMIGLEAIGAFDGFRIAQGGVNRNLLIKSVTLQRCYRHDANRGEGTYWGKTSGIDSEKPMFEKIVVEDNVFVRCAAETVQIQDMVDASIEKIIRNNVGMGGASDVLSPFQSGQGNSCQLVHGDGNALITKNIFGGSVDQGIIQFGTNHGTGTGRVKYFDNLFLDARSWLYIHNSTVDTGLIFEWQRMTLLRESNRWKRNLWRSATTDLISPNNGVSIWKFKQVKSDSTFPTLFGTITDFDVQDAGVDDTFPDPEFVNSGLEYGELAGEKYDYFGHYSYTRYWGQYNGQHINSITNNGSGDIRLVMGNLHMLSGGETAFLFGTANYDGEYIGAVTVIDSTTIDLTGVSYIADELTQTQWAFASPPTFHSGEILIISNNTYGIKFVQCLIDNFEVPNRTYNPVTDVTNFAEIFWDVNGVRSDKVEYTGIPDPRTTGLFPPDDLRLIPGSYWSNRGYGVRWQEHSIAYEKYRYYIADDAAGANKLIIPEAKEKVFNIDDLTYIWVKQQTGKYVVGSVTPVDSNGVIGTEAFATGIII